MGVASRQEGNHNGACVNAETKEERKERIKKYRQAGSRDGAKEAAFGSRRKNWTVEKR